jgi:hypothetical protein
MRGQHRRDSRPWQLTSAFPGVLRLPANQIMAFTMTKLGRRGIFGLVLTTLAASCASPGKGLVECPLSGSEQQQAVLEIVPRGTPRADAERRLRDAGIEYSAGQRNSIYYLGLWNRADGQRWHINVALLFDKDGRLYQTRTADSATEPITSEMAAAARRQADAANSDGAASATGAPSAIQDDDLRIPFPDQVEPTKARR